MEEECEKCGSEQIKIICLNCGAFPEYECTECKYVHNKCSNPNPLFSCVIDCDTKFCEQCGFCEYCTSICTICEKCTDCTGDWDYFCHQCDKCESCNKHCNRCGYCGITCAGCGRCDGCSAICEECGNCEWCDDILICTECSLCINHVKFSYCHGSRKECNDCKGIEHFCDGCDNCEECQKHCVVCGECLGEFGKKCFCKGCEEKLTYKMGIPTVCFDIIKTFYKRP